MFTNQKSIDGVNNVEKNTEDISTINDTAHFEDVAFDTITADLDVGGNITCDNVVFSDIFRSVPNNLGQNALQPAYSHNSDTNSGMFFDVTSGDTIGWSTSGIERLTLNTTDLKSTVPITVPVGAVGDTSIQFTSDPNTGIYSSAAENVDIATSGVNRININTTDITATLPYSNSGQPCLIVASSGSQTITTATVTTFTTWDTPTENRGFTSFTSGVLTVADAGFYLVTYAVKWATGTANKNRQAWIEINASANSLQAAESIWTDAADSTVKMSGATIVELSASDTLSLEVFHREGGDLDCGGTTTNLNYLNVVKLF